MPATEWAGDSGILHVGHRWEGKGEGGLWVRTHRRDVSREAVTFCAQGRKDFADSGSDGWYGRVRGA